MVVASTFPELSEWTLFFTLCPIRQGKTQKHLAPFPMYAVLELDLALLPFSKVLQSHLVDDVISHSHQNFFLELEQKK